MKASSHRQVLLPKRIERSIAQGFGVVAPARGPENTLRALTSRAGATESENKRAAGRYASAAALVGVAACMLWACGKDAASPAATEDVPANMLPATPASSDGTMTTHSTDKEPLPAVSAAGAAAPILQPMAASAGSGSTPVTPLPMDTELRPGDNCMERRVSYTKPCTNDPDPCGLKSGWAGDEYCLKAPKPDEGIQIHIGPKDYQDMADVEKYVIKVGEEFNNSVIGPIDLAEKKWWNRITVHMRPGSHHWISTVVAGKPEAKFYSDTSCGGASSIGSLGGGQNLIYDNPPGGKPAPENEGLGRAVPGDSSLCMNLHAYNFGDKPQLREMWINLYFVDEDKVTQKAAGIGMVGGLGLSLPAHQNKTETYSGKFAGDGRIIQLFGHRHVWTPRFAVWLNEKMIYESFSWEESVTFNYDSLTMNPPINTEGKMDGAVSGQIPFKSGDTLKFSCFIENKSDKTLGFSNELYDGEMCNLWGSTVGAGLSGNFP